jgi:hypothetical protein
MQSQSTPDEISLRQVLYKLKASFAFLLSRILLILVFAVLGGILGLGYAYKKTPKYVGRLTFVVEEEKSSGLGLSGAMGLASTLGIDLGGGASGVFSGANLMEFMKSRLIIEKALLSSNTIDGKKQTLADYYLQATNKDLADGISATGTIFPENVKRETLSFKQDSLLGVLYKNIAGTDGIFRVYQVDKKIGIITVETKFFREEFAKKFTEAVVKEVSDFYIETKSKKARQNYEILLRQTDSVRNELNLAITGVASSTENTFNLNSAMALPRATGLKRQVDVQANTAILTQLVANLEMAKVTLRKETPLIQIIDTPILPLPKEAIGKIMGGMEGALLGICLIIGFLLVNRWSKRYFAQPI